MDYIDSVKKIFQYYKLLGEKAIDQLEESQLFFQHHEDTNSIAIIIQHLSGNMLSRWTDVLIADGEKSWRDRENEFKKNLSTKAEVMEQWQKGWACLFNALESFAEKDLVTIIYIRNEGQSLLEAINRQLAHYPYHVGQIVLLAKELKQTPWSSLSIARNESISYNERKFSKEKGVRSFIDSELNQDSKNADINV